MTGRFKPSLLEKKDVKKDTFCHVFFRIRLDYLTLLHCIRDKYILKGKKQMLKVIM